MKSQVHELTIQVNEGEDTVDRQCWRQFHYPYQHQRRHLARAACHGQDQSGENAGGRRRQHDALHGLPLRGAARQGALAHTAWNRAQRLLCGYDNHRHGHERQGQRRPDNASRAERGSRKRIVEKQFVDAAADKIHEETKPKHPENDGWHPGKVVHGNPYRTHDEALLGIFPQVHGRKHAKRRDGHAHQHGHHEGTKNRRKDAALGVGFARLLGKESPHVMSE